MIEQYQTDYSKILKETRSIAVVGLSPKSTRPSYQVAQYLLEKGYEIFPVNPGQKSILGLTCYPDLQSIPAHVDIVDIFRNPADVPKIVADAIEIGARIVWMQLGIVHEAAAAKARAAGLIVVMDRCLKIDHQQLA
jgi:predicted CoA-binding protein